MKRLVDVLTVCVPRSLIDETTRLLRGAGTHGFEAIVVWAGVFSDDSAFDVTTVIRPKQESMRSRDGLLSAVDGEEIFRINKLLSDSSLRLIAQLHTHPTHAYHSETDDTFPLLSARGALSIVVPDFAADGLVIDRCAVYRLDSGNSWRALGPEDVRSLVHVVDS